MEIQPAPTTQSGAQQQKIDDTRDARESERKAADDADIERLEIERAELDRADTDPGVGDNVDIEA